MGGPASAAPIEEVQPAIKSLHNNDEITENSSKLQCFTSLPLPVTNDLERLNLYAISLRATCEQLQSQLSFQSTSSAATFTAMEKLKIQVASCEFKTKEQLEKSMFLERYAAHVVAERNALLHNDNNEKCVVSHSCCINSKHKNDLLDTIPSITAFRGETLAWAQKECMALRQELETLRLNANKASSANVRQNTMEKSDSEVTILQDHLRQRISKHAAAEALANKTQEELSQAKSSVNDLKSKIQNQKSELNEIKKSYKDLQDESKTSENALRRQHKADASLISKLEKDLKARNDERVSLIAENEALRSQVSTLEDSKNQSSLASQYRVTLEKERNQFYNREQELLGIIDDLKAEKSPPGRRNDDHHSSLLFGNNSNLSSDDDDGTLDNVSLLSSIDKQHSSDDENDDDDQFVNEILNRARARRENEQRLAINDEAKSK